MFQLSRKDGYIMTKEKKDDVKKAEKKTMMVQDVLKSVSDFLDRKITTRRILRLFFFSAALWIFFEVLYRYMWPILFYLNKKHGMGF